MGAVWRPGTAVWVIRTGIVLPAFREAPGDALHVARQAFEAGVDGVFCYDHLWPIGEPDRPALAPFPILAVLAADAALEEMATPGGGPYFGTLVARVGLAPNGVLLGQFRAQLLAPGRIIAGLGTGDRLSEAENRAYGIPFPPAAERRADMVELGRALRTLGMTVWVAGGPARGSSRRRRSGRWSLSGTPIRPWWPVRPRVPRRWRSPGAGRRLGGATLETRIAALAHAGATWAIFGWPIDPAALVAAARGAVSSRCPGNLRSGRRLARWNFAGSTGCPPMSSPPSTT